MKMLLAATAALTATGAFSQDHHPHHPDPVAVTTPGGIDPNVILRPPAGWSEPQLVLFREHMAYFPARWTAEQRAMYRAQLGVPPIQWTPEQRMLYHEHMGNLPPSWSARQRTMYEDQLRPIMTPWEAGGTGGDAAVGTTKNDLVDTQGATILEDSQRGIDADGAPDEPQD